MREKCKDSRSDEKYWDDFEHGKMQWQKVQFLRCWTSVVNQFFIPKELLKQWLLRNLIPPPLSSDSSSRTYTPLQQRRRD